MLFYEGLKVTCLFSKSIHATEDFKGVAKLKIWIVFSPSCFILTTKNTFYKHLHQLSFNVFFSFLVFSLNSFQVEIPQVL